MGGDFTTEEILKKFDKTFIADWMLDAWKEARQLERREQITKQKHNELNTWQEFWTELKDDKDSVVNKLAKNKEIR